jgi:Cytochrome c7 and related cytochrome c
MPRRVRTTKNLAQRMDLQYFTRPHPFRSWRLWLSILIPVVAVGWFVVQRANSQKVYSSGPLSAAHAVLGKQCGICHVTTKGAFRARVSDDACSKCHDAPPHHPDRVTFTASCSSCHIEHQGSLRLASTKDEGCIQCHKDLVTRNGKLLYARVVTEFNQQHPEFAASRPGARDPSQVKLNHYAHLRPNLGGPAGPVQMDCQDCHRLTEPVRGWPYAILQPAAQPSTILPSMDADTRHSRSRDYMLPILYANQCAGCHIKDLEFDKRFEQAAPHDKPEVVQAFLIQQYSDYFASHPGALSEPVAPERILPGAMKGPLPAPHTRQEWLDQQVMLADLLLFGKGCKLCHVINGGSGGSVGVVARSSIPSRWFLHAEFKHDSHRLLTCTACHDRTPESRDTAEILLPGIATCRKCHQGDGPRHDAASGRCSECHSYHDWSMEQPTKGLFTIPQLRAGR